MPNEGTQTTQHQLELAIAALEAQRTVLGDAVVDAALEPIYEKLAGLKSDEQPDYKRKLVSILFMDIAGHTQIVRHLDPEENMEIIDHALARLALPIQRNGGHIARYQGDGFKAVFGLPVAQENDPESAVHAGLGILSEAAQIAQEMEAERGIKGFTVRVGIDTGQVFSGGITEGENTIKGNPVNMGARLESAAQPGTILISHNTYHHVRDVFDLQPLEPILAKGFDKPMPVYQVIAVKKTTFRSPMYGVEGVETRMVGREEEMNLLQDAFTAAKGEGVSKFVTILGEAGLGKSRLLYEFENWIDIQPGSVNVFRGRARLETQRLPYNLVRNIFATRFNILEDDPNQVLRSKIENGFRETLGSNPNWRTDAHFAGHLMGYDFHDSLDLQNISEDPKQIRDRVLAFIITYLKAVASTQPPLLFLFEDLHWADDSSLDFLTRVAGALQGQPVMFLGTARPGLYDRRTGWMQTLSTHYWLHLYPLSSDSGNQLVQELLKNAAEIPPELFELIASNAEGNPFYTEELIKMLIEDKVIVKGDGPWQIQSHKLSELHIPPTLVGILQARLDALGKDERTVLQQASVVGRIFWDAVLLHLNRTDDRNGLANDVVLNSLTTLQDKEMVYPRVLSAFTEAREHIFKHAVLREVTYESVLRRLRRIYHAKVAEWLIEHGKERIGENWGLIADHLELAGRQALALEYLQRAGEQAAASFANLEAVEYFTRALNLTPENHFSTRFQILLSRNLVYDLLGNREAQAGDLPVLDEIAEKMEGSPEDRAIFQAKVAQRRSKLADQIGNFEEAARAAERTVQLAQTGGDVQMEAAGRIRWIVALWRQGYYDDAQKLAEETLVTTRESGIKLYEAHALVQLGNIAWFHNQLSLAASHYEHALPFYHELGYLSGTAAVYHNLGLVNMEQEEYTGAKSYFKQAQEQLQKVGNTQGLAQTYSSLGNIAQRQWDIEQATQYFLTALQLSQDVVDRNNEAIIYSNLGRINLDSGDYKTSRKYYDQGLKLAKSIANRRTQCLILAEIGLLHSLEADFKNACQIQEQALRLAEEIGLESVKSSTLIAYGYTLTESKAYDQAQEVYSEALALCSQINNPDVVVEANTGLGRIMFARNALESAQLYAQIILETIERKGSARNSLSLLTYLTCIQILTALHDPQAVKILEDAYHLLCERQNNFQDPTARKRFIEAVPWHREIVHLWEHRDTEISKLGLE